MARQPLNPDEVRELIRGEQELMYLRNKVNREKRKVECLERRFVDVTETLRAEKNKHNLSVAAQPSATTSTMKAEENVGNGSGVNQGVNAGGQNAIGEPNVENCPPPHANE